MVVWDDDDPADLSRITRNIAALEDSFTQTADQRVLPSLELARAWHRSVFAGCRVPRSYYVGNFRGQDPALPDLFVYGVGIAGDEGVPPDKVMDQLLYFQGQLQTRTTDLDAGLPVGGPPSDDAMLKAVLLLLSWAHGEWIRIHPFANGNGRIARLWGNWLAIRYALPPFIQIQPRPLGHNYEQSASVSMLGYHRAMRRTFERMLDEWIAAHPQSQT